MSQIAEIRADKKQRKHLIPAKSKTSSKYDFYNIITLGIAQ